MCSRLGKLPPTGQVVYILGFANSTVSVEKTQLKNKTKAKTKLKKILRTQLCYSRVKADTGRM